MRSFGYNGAKEVLEVEFQSGAVYQYFDVPPAIHNQLAKAESKGRYFNSAIRDTYQCLQVNRKQRRAASR